MPTPTFELLAISDRASLDISLPDAFTKWLGRLAAAGVGALQIREKDLDDRTVYELARQARAVLSTVLVNGRLDLALAAGADGAHLPADGVPVAALRCRFGPGVLLGVSTHGVEEVERALQDGADYVTFGPVWPTPSKERYGPPLGIGELARAARVGIPVYALGGVMLSRFGEAAAAGAAGVAGIRLFQGSALEEAVLTARQCFSKG
ncbi:MAG TPA: thiamine phosphate synthase [Thermoanaerobaculia bacterium]|nr:thiamine phosphate synthase [Thermoanaerobaculia bacterium]